MKNLGLAVISKNEEKSIERCIRSVPFASDVVLIDSNSTDKTVEIAKQCGARVIVRSWPGYAKQKQFAIEQLQTDWILALDADEYLSIELQDEIQKLLGDEFTSEGYYLKRKHVFLKKLLHQGKGVDFQLRLFKNGKGHYDDRIVHEKIIIQGSTQKLKEAMIHESSVTLQDEMEKITRDTELELSYHNGRHIGFYQIFIVPLTYFFNMLFLKSTWKDGLPGIIFLTMTTFKYFLLFSKLYELNINKTNKSLEKK